MLFYSNTKDIKKIPSSYIILYVADKEDEIINSSSNIIFCDSLFPDEIYYGNERGYYNSLKRNFNMKVINSIMLQLSKCANIVIIYNKDMKKIVGYNYAKIICKFIYNRYGYKTYKFTNDITIEMMDSSKIVRINKYTEDCVKLLKEMKNDAKSVSETSLFK